MIRQGMDWLWCARCESVCREWEPSVAVSDVTYMLSLHRLWHCVPVSEEPAS